MISILIVFNNSSVIGSTLGKGKVGIAQAFLIKRFPVIRASRELDCWLLGLLPLLSFFCNFHLLHQREKTWVNCIIVLDCLNHV